ncbi:MAG: hypothetical protein R2856_14080 [Caldilineaceae bacterium]
MVGNCARIEPGTIPDIEPPWSAIAAAHYARKGTRRIIHPRTEQIADALRLIIDSGTPAA